LAKCTAFPKTLTPGHRGLLWTDDYKDYTRHVLTARLLKKNLDRKQYLFPLGFDLQYNMNLLIDSQVKDNDFEGLRSYTSSWPLEEKRQEFVDVFDKTIGDYMAIRMKFENEL